MISCNSCLDRITRRRWELMEASDYLRPHWLEELELEYQAARAEGWPFNDCDECEEGIKKEVEQTQG